MNCGFVQGLEEKERRKKEKETEGQRMCVWMEEEDSRKKIYCEKLLLTNWQHKRERKQIKQKKFLPIVH